jgi:hypothetical protein
MDFIQPKNQSNIKNVIEIKTKNEIEAYLATRGKSRVYEGARNLSLNVSDDYGERFLVELIQNAHDAHSKANHDGEISVIFDPEETEFGCLYVANKGIGFSEGNFEAITNIALSSKSVNEDIGNKGLGFRSVLQICQSPEIYSSTNTKLAFNGFCFRFANNFDVLSFLSPGDNELAKEIEENMPCLFLPIYQDNRPGLIPSFAESGFASVIRLPLTSEKSQESVKQQMKEVLDRDEPLNLFFERISKVSIELKGEYCRDLHHQLIKKWQINDQVCISKVKVADELYLMAHSYLLKDEFNLALNTSLEQEKIPQTWSDWQGSACVSVAVKMEDATTKNGLFYCFLPLGEKGAAPFSGYVNANFYTSMDRRSLISNVPLNHYFIEKSADLCCLMIKFLIQQNLYESPSAVINLLCWKYPYKDIMHKALSSGEEPLIRNKLLPIDHSGKDNAWSSLEHIRTFGSENECLTPTLLSKVSNASILCKNLNEKQVSSIQNFFSGFHSFYPSPIELVKWFEDAAKYLLDNNATPSEWASYYNEIATAMDDNAESLNGCLFLLSTNNDLVAARPKQAKNKKQEIDIYFPPIRTGSIEDDEELDLTEFPDELQSSFTLLSKTIPWSLKSDGCRKARAFLSDNNLVKDYDKRELLRTLAKITRDNDDSNVRQQALMWAFKLWSSGRSLANKDTRSARFFIPAKRGWISAEKAMFGAGWSDAINGSKLAKYIKQAKNHSTEIERCSQNFVSTYKGWKFEVGAENDWYKFLDAVGVRDHLRLFLHSKLSKNASARWLPSALSGELALSDEAKKLWKNELEDFPKRAAFNSVDYSARVNVWLIPSILEYETLDNETKKLFASQLIIALQDISAQHLSFKVSRNGSDIKNLLSPLAVFIKKLPWMPVAKKATTASFIAPEDSWLFNIEDEPTPRFLKFIIPSISKSLETVNSNRYIEMLGYKCIEDSKHSKELLNVLLDSLVNGISDVSDLKRFKELYIPAWEEVVRNKDIGHLSKLPINVGNDIRLLNVSDEIEENSTFYYVDEDNPSKVELLQSLELPFFDFDDAYLEESWKVLEEIAPMRFTKLSQEELYVIVDGEKIGPDSQIQTLENIFDSSFFDLLVVIAAHKGQRFFSATIAPLLKLRMQARQLGVLVGKNIEVAMADKVSRLPDSVRGAVVTKYNDQNILVVQSETQIFDLKLLAKVPEQFAHAVGYPSLSSAFEAAFLRLLQESVTPNSKDAFVKYFSSITNVSEKRIGETLKYIRGDLSTNIGFASLLAVIKNQPELKKEVLELLEHSNTICEDEAVIVLAPIASLFDFEPHSFLKKLNNIFSPRDLIEEFDLTTDQINKAIKMCDSYALISNETQHKQQFSSFLNQNKNDINEKLRQYFITNYDSGNSLAKYNQLKKEIDTINANSDWFYKYDDLSDKTMQYQINMWLDKSLQLVKGSDDILEPLTYVRDKNNEKLQRFWKNLGPIISSWIQHTDEIISLEVKKAWKEPLASRNEYMVMANKGGWLDFRLLNDDSIAEHLGLYDIWPIGKKPIVDLLAWGIDESIIEERKRLLEQKNFEEEKKRNQIVIDGKSCSANVEDFLELYDQLKGNFDDSRAFEGAGKNISSLANINSPSRKTNGWGGGSAGGKANMSNEQKLVVGLMGEAYAFEWLKRHHKKITVNDDCWVSGYRNQIFSSDSGDDSLGYDFIVRLKTITYYYEVKASQGDAFSFEMGPTEIACAQKYAADNQNKYRVLYVSNVTNQNETRIDMLPNPFSTAGSKHIKLVGNGSVTFKFAIK